MTWLAFDNFKLRQYSGNAIDFSVAGAQDLRVALITSAVNPQAALRGTAVFFSDLGATQVTGGGYTANGLVITNSSKAFSFPTTNVLRWDVEDLVWTQNASGFTNARYAILYRFVTALTSSPLIAAYDLGSDRGNVAGDLRLETPNGIFEKTG